MARYKTVDRSFALGHPCFGDSRGAGVFGRMAGLEPGNRHHGLVGHRRFSVFRSRFARGTGVSRRAVIVADTAHAAMGSMAIDPVICRLASATGADHRSALGRYVSASDILDCDPDPRYHIGAYTNCFAVALAGDFDTLVCCSDLEISVRRTVLLNRTHDHG